MRSLRHIHAIMGVFASLYYSPRVNSNGFAVSGADAQNAQDAVRERVNSWLAELGY